ncbi:hypothetical protein HYH02_008293 [Chlamydomonas schloesseri]|uniref:protein-serine/threonine phosphatase n=1 Tax=Chlamydomonas schloesseri TaxID=2026947 RepID=A0A835WFZ4_9CHLO|nr:hypothetical protein HYH02_008293 [Chlamydomonas schloesseri]|eukprot:KAG2446732.1 hypothetical protein HYH02_008293 [Chlamydomonas schloesseri]
MQYDEEPGSCSDDRKHEQDDQLEEQHGRKRQRRDHRRSIFFSTANSDSDSDDEEADDAVGLNGFGAAGLQCELAVVSASALTKGVLLSPITRRSTSPCLASTSAFVAVHEEPNACFRSYMEDRSAAMTADGVAYLGIYDGHGGIDASTFLQRHLLGAIQEHLQPGCDVHDALTTAYSATNAAFRATGSIQGSTATTIILKHNRLIAANVGDSPAFVVKKSGEVYSVIQEHKIEGEEAARIAAQGVPIYRSPTGPAYMGTPDGTRWLNMSRAFGDFVYPAISCEPHVCSLDVSDGKFLVMGSDGLTEKWPVAEAAQYVQQLASAGWSLPAICRCLVERALARGSTDNITCCVVDLEAYMAQAQEAGAAEAAAAEAEREGTSGPGSSGGAVAATPLEEAAGEAPAAAAGDCEAASGAAAAAAALEPLRHSPDDELAPEEFEQWQLRRQQEQQLVGTPCGSGRCTGGAEADKDLVCHETPAEEQGREPTGEQQQPQPQQDTPSLTLPGDADGPSPLVAEVAAGSPAQVDEGEVTVVAASPCESGCAGGAEGKPAVAAATPEPEAAGCTSAEAAHA